MSPSTPSAAPPSSASSLAPSLMPSASSKPSAYPYTYQVNEGVRSSYLPGANYNNYYTNHSPYIKSKNSSSLKLLNQLTSSSTKSQSLAILTHTHFFSPANFTAHTRKASAPRHSIARMRMRTGPKLRQTDCELTPHLC